MIATFVMLLLAQATPVPIQQIDWEISLSGNMTNSPEPDEPVRPPTEMILMSGNVIGQVVLTEIETRLHVSASNCPNGISSITTSVEVPLNLTVPDQVKHFRSAMSAITGIQNACGITVIDPLAGNFVSVLSTLSARNDSYRAARTKWLSNRSNTNAEKRAQ